MIAVLNYEINDFLEEIKDKRVFCFGCGKYFRQFITHHPQISVCGVIDNYRKEEFVSVEEGKYQIYSIKDFSDIYQGDCVLVVTVRSFEEVVDQLEEAEKLDGIPCFFPFLVENYFNIEDDQRRLMKRQIERLAERTHIERQREYGEAGGRYYQIWEYIERTNIGGSKARTDISDMLTTQGYKMVKIHCSGRESASLSRQQMREEWESLFENIEDNAVVCMQHPLPEDSDAPEQIWRKMKEEKHTRFIVVVHEVESLRKTYFAPYRQKEFNAILAIGDVFIVHNDVMRQFFIEQGIDRERVISLDIFDYLETKANVKKYFERSVTIAANLDLTKSPYLLHLKELESLKIHLYGPHYTEEIVSGSKNISYHGSLPTEVIPEKLDRGFGLIWDGDSIATCSGGTGEYLKYNNPHKLSLYLSAGLPVIIWSQAAQAQFVQKHGVGFCVDSLYEVGARLAEIDEEQYKDYAQKAESLSKGLKEGVCFKSALKKAEDILCQLYR